MLYLELPGALTETARERFEQGRPVADAELVLRAPVEPARPRAASGPGILQRRAGSVVLRATGPLDTALEADGPLELDLPASLAEVLAAAAARSPQAAVLLGRADRPLAAVYRRGARLRPDDAVHSGDELELLLVISGGAR